MINGGRADYPKTVILYQLKSLFVVFIDLKAVAADAAIQTRGSPYCPRIDTVQSKQLLCLHKICHIVKCYQVLFHYFTFSKILIFLYNIICRQI